MLKALWQENCQWMVHAVQSLYYDADINYKVNNRGQI